jgi:hypothetical protein
MSKIKKWRCRGDMRIVQEWVKDKSRKKRVSRLGTGNWEEDINEGRGNG